MLDRRSDPLAWRVSSHGNGAGPAGRPASTTGTALAASSAKRGSRGSMSVSRNPSTRPAAASRSYAGRAIAASPGTICNSSA